MKEEFYQQIGTNRLGQIKVVAVSGASPCTQILTAYISSDWEERFEVLDKQRNGHHVIQFGNLKQAYDGDGWKTVRE
jgi:hypothetical protein